MEFTASVIFRDFLGSVSFYIILFLADNFSFRKDRSRYFVMSDNNNDFMYEEYMGKLATFIDVSNCLPLAKAKKFGKDGLLNEAMKFLKTAQSFKNTDKVSRRIDALQKVIDDEKSSEEEDGEQQGVQVSLPFPL